MKPRILLGWSSALCLSAMPLLGQETNQVEQLKKELQEMQQNFERIQREQRQQMEALHQQIETLEKQQSSAAAEQAKLKNLVEARSAAPPAAETAPKPWSPSDPIRLLGGPHSYLNLSFDALFAAGGSTANDIERGLQLGGHDPVQRGFTVQNLETTFEGMVDPYFRGQANIILQIDREGESFLEVEEAYLETLSLPGRLQLKAGQYFTEFGRLNQFHPHVWDFVDQPLVNGRFLGGDGLRNAGARLSWLAPTPFYSELFLSAQNSQGETAASFRNGNEGEPLFGRLMDQGSVQSLGDMLFVPRYAASFNLSESQTLLAGVSAAFGPNGSGPDTDTQLYGLDLFWKWKPVNHNKGFPFVSWQSEAMLRRYEAGAFDWDRNGDGNLDPDEQDADGNGTPDLLARETLSDWGFYSQLLWGIRPRWVAGLRGDYVAGSQAGYEELLGDDLQRGRRWRLSPNFTWFPTEFSKLRLQYNHDDRKSIGVDHSVWLQFEFLLGSHGAHKF
ncbi:MAG: hypothetical protein HY735_33475 [Verrucomicrobia bacterium]|nr:hypothetical protein [Verrucomicrobiota bacterium]